MKFAFTMPDLDSPLNFTSKKALNMHNSNLPKNVKMAQKRYQDLRTCHKSLYKPSDPKLLQTISRELSIILRHGLRR